MGKGWTHSICPMCWDDQREGEPLKIRNPKKEICCFCGEETQDGIYVRCNPSIPNYCVHDD